MLAKLIENNVIEEKDLTYSIEEIYKNNALLSAKDKHHLARCLYVKYNKNKNFSKAGKYLVASNQFRDQTLKYNINNDQYFVDKLIKNFNQKKVLTHTKLISKKSAPEPIFILGPPC